MDVKEKTLTTRERVALDIAMGITAHYGLENDKITPDNMRAIFEDSFAFADIFFDVASKQK